MPREQALGVMAAIAVIVLALMWWGWRGRQRRSAPLVGALPALPTEVGVALYGPVPGIYVTSTTHGDWLDRVAAQDLGYRAKAVASVFSHGVLIERAGAKDVYIPAEQITDVTTAPGIAGKFTGGDGIVIVSWGVDAKYGETTELDTGFRTEFKKDREPLVEAVKNIIVSQSKETK